MLVQSTSTRWEQRRHQWWLSAGRSWWQWLFCRRPPPPPLPRDAAGSSSFGTKSVARNTSDCRKYVLGGWRVKIMRQIYWYCSSNLGVQRRIHSFYHHFQRKIVFNTANPSLSTLQGRISRGTRVSAIGGGFPNTSLVLMEHGYNNSRVLVEYGHSIIINPSLGSALRNPSMQTWYFSHLNLSEFGELVMPTARVLA